MNDKIAKTIGILRRRSISEYEIFASVSDNIRAESKECTMGSLVRSNDSGISLRVFIDGAMGFSYASEATDDFVDSALTSARYQFKDKLYMLPGKQDEYVSIPLYDEKVAGLTAEDCIAEAIKLEQSARDADERITQVRKASFSRTVSTVRIVNSHGIDVSSRQSFVSSSIMVMARQDDDTQSGYEFDFSHYVKDIDVEGVGRQAARKATDMLLARKIQTVRLPVVFDNTTTAQILEFISDAFIGENVVKGKSYLRDKRGIKYFAPQVTLVDNSLDPKAADACAFDGEGVSTKKTTLVDKGTVAGFVYDTYWGNVSGKVSTGNSVRGGYRSTPSSGIRHLCMEPGDQGLESRMKGLSRVLKITDIMGMHTANPISGEFSVGVNGILCEGDTPCYPVREAAISGNIYELFSRVASVGIDMREFGNVLCPSMMIESIDVSGG